MISMSLTYQNQPCKSSSGFWLLTFESKSYEMDLPDYFKLLLITLIIKLETGFCEFPKKEARGFMLSGLPGPSSSPPPRGRGFCAPCVSPHLSSPPTPAACAVQGTASFGGEKFLQGKKQLQA